MLEPARMISSLQITHWKRVSVGALAMPGAKRRDEFSFRDLLSHAKSYFTLPSLMFPSHWERSATGLHQSWAQQILNTLLWVWEAVFTQEGV